MLRGSHEPARIVLLVLATLVVVFVREPSAAASLCEEVTMQEQVDHASAIFVGRVMSNVAGEDANLVTLRITEPLKGVSGRDSVSVWAQRSKYHWAFAVGDEYVVFAIPNERATETQKKTTPLWTFVCMGDLQTSAVPEETTKQHLAAIRRILHSPSPAPSAAADGGSPSIPDASIDVGSDAGSDAEVDAAAAPPLASVAPARSGCAGCAATSRSTGAAWPIEGVALLALLRRRRRGFRPSARR